MPATYLTEGKHTEYIKNTKNKESRKQSISKKWAMDLNRVAKEEIKVAKKHHKKFSSSSASSELQMKTIPSYLCQND